MTSNDTTMNE